MHVGVCCPAILFLPSWNVHVGMRSYCAVTRACVPVRVRVCVTIPFHFFLPVVHLPPRLLLLIECRLRVRACSSCLLFSHVVRLRPPPPGGGPARRPACLRACVPACLQWNNLCRGEDTQCAGVCRVQGGGELQCLQRRAHSFRVRTAFVARAWAWRCAEKRVWAPVFSSTTPVQHHRCRPQARSQYI